MSSRSLTYSLLSIIALALLLAAAGWRLAGGGSSAARLAQTAPQLKDSSQPDTPNYPKGDPVDTFRAAKTTEERAEIMGQFMSLGHARNPAMLADAMRDPDVKLRVSAVEYSASLTPLEACEVYRTSAINDQSDVREMTWSLLAPHPEENRALVYGEALAKGSPAVMEEVFSEMGRQPGRMLFESMINQMLKTTEPARSARILKEVQAWLVPGGGEVPKFSSPQAVSGWWSQQRKNYDEFMLRVDL
jgi:hypothetical protein